jgi:curved DNA-binding protein CbpA
MSPFVVLDVKPTSTDEEVRAAYQRLLREYPPEKSPAEFQAIQAAYQATKNTRQRWKAFLLECEIPGEDPVDVVRKFSQLPGKAKPPGAPAFRAFLTACVKAAETKK